MSAGERVQMSHMTEERGGEGLGQRRRLRYCRVGGTPQETSYSGSFDSNAKWVSSTASYE